MSTENEKRPEGTERREYQSREGGQRSDYGQRRPYRPRTNEGGYQNREGGYQQQEGGYRPRRRFNSYDRQERNYGDDNRQGGYRPRRQYNNDRNDNREGGYQQREGGYQQREGGYQQREGGYNRGGYNRGGYNNRQGGYNRGGQREGGYNPNRRYNQNRDFSRDFNNEGEEGGQQHGGYQRRPYQQRQGGYNRGGYNRGGYNNRQGGYNNRGGYNRGGYNNRQDGYQPRNNWGKQRVDYKDVAFDPTKPVRLNKFLANSGLCSRREADEFISAGLVTVNEQIITELGTKVSYEDVVKFNGERVNPEKKVYVLLNKPKNYVTTSDDPQGRKTVMDLVKNSCPERIYPVGRLDRNTTGVLLFTNDGDMASKLTHPKFLKKKIYQVTLDRNLSKADMETLVSGVELEDGEAHADVLSYIDDERKNLVGIEIHSGRNRIVRRLFEHLDYKVEKLDRVYFAGLTKKGLRRGDWRFLTQDEVSMLAMGSYE